MLAGVVVAIVIAIQERIIGWMRKGKFARSRCFGGSIKPRNRRAIFVGAPVTAVVTRY